MLRKREEENFIYKLNVHDARYLKTEISAEIAIPQTFIYLFFAIGSFIDRHNSTVFLEKLI